MSLNPISKTIVLPDGREIVLETGKLAKQADGIQRKICFYRAFPWGIHSS